MVTLVVPIVALEQLSNSDELAAPGWLQDVQSIRETWPEA
jgi:hypothetical protein